MSGNRDRLFRFLVPCLAVALCLVVAEVTLRLLPVYRGLYSENVTEDQPVFRFHPNREFTWSIGWRFVNPNAGRTNNAGFVNDEDYDAGDSRPLLAVVGDSYVEALMVPYKDTLQGRLQHRVGTAGRVYSFAASGAPLSQYLAWARYARDTYRPDGLVVVVVGNDFDESLAKYKQGAGFHHFFETADGNLALRLVPYRRGLLSKIGRHSALVSYVVFHLHIQSALSALRKRVRAVMESGGSPDEGSTPKFVGNTAAAAGKARVEDSKRAVDAFLKMLPEESGLPPRRIVIVIDAIRPAIYQPELAAATEGSYFCKMRRYMATQSRAAGMTVVDLTGPMKAAFKADGKKFDWSFDAHWNSHGHEVVAGAVAATPLFHSLFFGSATRKNRR